MFRNDYDLLLCGAVFHLAKRNAICAGSGICDGRKVATMFEMVVGGRLGQLDNVIV